MTAFAKKITEKVTAVAQRAEAVQYANEQKQRAEAAEAAVERVREAAEYFLHEYEGGEDPCAAAVLAALEQPADRSST